jgi:hypothetical protein
MISWQHLTYGFQSKPFYHLCFLAYKIFNELYLCRYFSGSLVFLCGNQRNNAFVMTVLSIPIRANLKNIIQ